MWAMRCPALPVDTGHLDVVGADVELDKAENLPPRFPGRTASVTVTGAIRHWCRDRGYQQ
jgi:hypothetical protein